MKVRKEIQREEVSDEVLAYTTLVKPILTATLYAIKQDVIAETGGYQNTKLKMLPRLYRDGAGDCGICFEYAVHEAIKENDPRVMSRIEDALKICKISPHGDTESILFGLEKNGKLGLIDTANELLTDDSQLLYGKQGRPAKLKRHINTISGAFKNRKTRPSLPTSINGLWKTDLFVGSPSVDNWIGTSVKINPKQLEGANGLRVGIVPIRAGQTDKVRRDETKNLVICPLHHDHDFMQAFYEAWRIIQAFIKSDAKTPKEVLLPDPAQREVCRILEERREFPIVDVIDALDVFGQSGLVETSVIEVETETLNSDGVTDLMIAPRGLDI
ncbi:hypothetical protein [Sinirhodobacter huangdaonensis]|uniref:Uncharacterized protein n=1 Tax=Paenirhodobacter huangdaonensis TaxID=2501515 RepID=A0A443LNK8_9RHOB|nr:hypothetical protein [Sinirhodobacter huangdaonensis]RWR50749.1 hypothetical protein EOW66_14045 [Sinirhodobacter huangdaonensis]